MCDMTIDELHLQISDLTEMLHTQSKENTELKAQLKAKRCYGFCNNAEDCHIYAKGERS